MAGQLLANARSGAFSIAGIALIVAGTFIGFRGVALGVRCSVSSQYLQERFNLPERQGCVVLRVSAGAEKAGIKRGDLIIALGDTPITSGRQFTILFEGKRRRTWTFTVIRPGEPEPLTFDVRSAERRSFEENPTDPLFYYLRARQDASDKPESAIEDYSRVIELEPTFDLAYLYRAQLYDRVADFGLAQQDFLKALELSPRLAEAHRVTGQFERQRGLPGAHFRARKAIELDMCEGGFEGYNVDCAEDYFLLATLQANAFDLYEPIATAQQAIRFWPDAVQAYYVLSTLYERIGDIATAASYARQYLDFPEEDRFSESEADAKRIRDLEN